ncbi:MAG: hypothetical protein IJR52_02415 [Selenomonadaceae bacterium]|nr:hypothetical protein [Selenomonadaceae bacterium]MBQ9496411.1 hypothetical protein [Selenomonadaceae bacterium]
MLGLVVLVGLINDFYLLKSSFLLLTQKKRSKRKGSLAGAAVVHSSEVEVTRNRSCPLRRHHVFSAGEARVHARLI